MQRVTGAGRSQRLVLAEFGKAENGLTTWDLRHLATPGRPLLAQETEIGHVFRSLQRLGLAEHSGEKRIQNLDVLRPQPFVVWVITDGGRSLLKWWEAGDAEGRPVRMASAERVTALAAAVAGGAGQCAPERRREWVGQLREAGCSLEDIADALRVSRHTARQLALEAVVITGAAGHSG